MLNGFDFRPAISIGYALLHNISEYLEIVPGNNVQVHVHIVEYFSYSYNPMDELLSDQTLERHIVSYKLQKKSLLILIRAFIDHELQ